MPTPRRRDANTRPPSVTTRLDRLERRLHGLQQVLAETGRRGEAAALRTDLELVDEIRRDLAA